MTSSNNVIPIGMLLIGLVMTVLIVIYNIDMTNYYNSMHLSAILNIDIIYRGNSTVVAAIREDIHLNSTASSYKGKNIAIGLAITTNKILPEQVQTKLPIFTTLLPSFCDTASLGYRYHFYLAHDHSDSYFSKPWSHKSFTKTFFSMIKTKCPESLTVFLHFVDCPHSGKPAWAQNDAMMAAYRDSMDYYYRVNDDTRMKSKKWTETFIDALSKYDPPNVGVVGPNHQGGNTAILTYDFVHRTHIDIFGFYYPRNFTTWFADDWVTKVYLPNKSKKMNDIVVLHTMSIGTRYNVESNGGQILDKQLEKDRKTLNSWLTKHRPKTPS